MSWFEGVPEPTPAELLAIEAEADVLAAEMALIDAEMAWLRDPGPATSAAYLAAVLDLVDLLDLADDLSEVA